MRYPKKRHPFRRAFDCTQYEDGPDFGGCLCPCWDNEILEVRAGEAPRMLRGCTQKLFQVMTRSAVIATLQTQEMIDGENGLRTDVQEMGRKIGDAVDSGMREIGRSVALTLAPIVRSPNYVSALMGADREVIDDGRHSVGVRQIEKDAGHTEAGAGAEPVIAGGEVADTGRSE